MKYQPSKHSLYVEIYNKLKEDIILGVYPPGSMLPSELELAESFYVSRITIQKAMQLLKNEGYISRTAGKGTFVENIPTKPQQHTIGIILCNISYSFGLRILTSVERCASKHGYHVIFKNSVDSAEEETKAINDLVALGVDGIIIQPVHKEFYNETLIQMHFNHFPIVLVDRCFSGFAIPSISTNNFEAAQAATQYLFDKGHTGIGFICSPQQNTSTIQDRIDGFTSAQILNNHSLSESNVLNTILSPHTSDNSDVFQKDVETIKEYLCRNKDITALISSEFTVTQLVMKAIRELHKKIPEDYSLIVFDEYESAELPIATHIKQNQMEIGRMAFETLLAKISNKMVSNKIYIPFEIVEGYTVRKL